MTKINLKKIKNKYKDIIAYGAPAKATTLLNFFGISEEINYVIEDNQLKHNKFIPGTDLQIKDKNILNKYNDSAVLVLAWNFYKEIKKNNPNIKNEFINIKDLEKPNS